MTPLGTMMRLSGRASFKFRAESRASWLYLVACLFLRASALLGVFQLLFLCSLRNAGDAPLSVLSVSGEVAGALDAEPAATSLPHSAAAGEEHSAVSDAAGLVQSEGASGGHLRRSHRTDEQQAGLQAGLAPPGEPGLKQRRLSDRGGFIRWWYRLHTLPRIDETSFPDELIDTHADQDDARSLTFITNPSPELVEFLQISDEDAKYGLVVKAKKVSVLSPGDALYEGYIHGVLTSRIPDGRRFFLPQFGIYRSSRRNWLLLFLPLVQGSLRTCMREAPRGFNLKLAAAEMLLAVQALHAAGYVHRDLKISNFLLGHDGHIYLADMESVIPMSSSGDLVGTRGYIPPEVEREDDDDWGFGGVTYNEKTDVYSLGKALNKMYEKLGRRIPTADRNDLLVLIRKMTERNPRYRITIAEALAEPFFKGVDFAALRRKCGPKPFSATEVRNDLKEEKRREADEVISWLSGQEVSRPDDASAVQSGSKEDQER